MAEYKVTIHFSRPVYDVIYVEADNEDEATDLALDQLPWDHDNAYIESVEEL